MPTVNHEVLLEKGGGPVIGDRPAERSTPSPGGTRREGRHAPPALYPYHERGGPGSNWPAVRSPFEKKRARRRRRP